MLIAALSYSVMGLSVHALGEDSWSMALLARALFGLPCALYGVKSLDLTKAQVFEKGLLIRSALAVSFLAFLYYSLQMIRPGDAFALVSMRPLWVAGIYLLLRRSKVKLFFWPLSMIGVLGVVLMEGGRLSGSPRFVVIAIALGLLGAGSTIAVDFCKGHSDRLMTLHYTVLMLIVAIIFILLKGNEWELSDWLNLRTFVIFSVMGAAGNLYTLFSIKAVKSVGAEVGSSIVLLTTVFSYAAGHLIWTVGFSWIGSLGILLTLLPCIFMIGFGGLSEKSSSYADHFRA
jgi:drug/metabolite transporter (DMT)-like permease